jgi:hypothetical protein
MGRYPDLAGKVAIVTAGAVVDKNAAAAEKKATALAAPGAGAGL